MSYNSLKGRFKDMFLDGSEANRLDPEPFPAFDPTYTGTSRKPSPERDTTSINALTESFPEFDSAGTDASRTPSPERNMTNANPLAEPFPEFDPTYTGHSRTPSPERDMTEQFEIETGLRFEKHDNFQHNNFQVDSSAVLPPDDASGSPLLQKISSTTSLFSGDSSVPIYTPDSENAPSSSLPVPLYPIVDGGSDSSKALASPLSTAFALLATATASPADATTRSVSVAESTESQTTYYLVDDAWDNLKLRGLTDIIRECIEQRKPIPPERATEISVVFMTIIQDVYPMTIYDAYDSHMDKLLNAMIANADSFDDPYSLLDKARRLKPIWQRMFVEKWAHIDSMRMKDMLGGTVKDLTDEEDSKKVIGEEQRGGMLRGMSMSVNKAGTGPVFSAPITTWAAARARSEGGAGFSLGEWWPNKAAAARDGIITARETIVTMNPNYGPTALAMVKGEEVEGPELNMTQYSVTSNVGTKETKELLHFLGRRGPFRVLRGDRLRSRLAPKAGLRYDGLYERQQWGYVLDPTDNTHRHTIILKRLDNQRSMSTVLQVPRPHHLDEFEVYKQWVASEMLLQAGQDNYAKWKQIEKEQNQEREEWLENVPALATSGFRSYATVPRKASYRQE
ncbi:uncharacterized protein PAC_09154 [Phialocephala subalpina]|uniref:Uncharacterized protein n=1 Tax=Phialocephala subalpina TaxID=576137 RepID=A0A1L7X2L3_9HELO|nr:uncharacterized protein PAC_09154 [Phialocephala subalpina]